MMFVDASAIVAIITDEPDSARLSQRLQAAESSITSALAFYEAVLAVRRKRLSTVEEARRDVADLLAVTNTTVVPITEAHAAGALAAFARYGKGQGHKAQLNMGDCFAYAAARHHGAALLFKGDDFAHTDITVA